MQRGESWQPWPYSVHHPGGHLATRPFLNSPHERHAPQPTCSPAPPAQSIPGTKMSPKPRREKGRSHRESGEVFNLGTFNTMGSCGESGAQPGRPHHQPRLRSPRTDRWEGGVPSHGWMSSRAQRPPPP